MTDTVSPAGIDFKDLEAKYAVDDTLSLERYVLVDGLPVVPEAKVEKLVKVLAKLFGKVAPVRNGEAGFHMPLEGGKSQGFAFVEFDSESGAREAVKAYNHKKLDTKHTLLVDRMATVAKYINGASAEFKEPVVPAFKPLPHLRSWLADSLGRDQAVMHKANEIGVFWFRKGGAPQPELAPTAGFTDGYVRWSPKGTYLLSVHPQGVALHAGPQFEIVARLPHRDVRLVDFSPDERFLVTGAQTPIAAGGVFKEADEGNNIVVWSIETQAALRTFPMPVTTPQRPRAPWPAFKWSSDSQYFARIPQPDTLAIYDSATMSLVGKKSSTLKGIEDFEFAPAEVAGQQLLVFWTPEMPNQTAKVCLMNAATKEIVRNRSLFNVVNARFIWQNNAQFLCVKIEHLTKNKKGLTSTLEIYRMQEKALPIEVLDFKETVLDFAWEPSSDRFALLSYFEPLPSPAQQQLQQQPMASGKNVLSFYALEREKRLEGTWREANHFERKDTGLLRWNPNGRFLATAGIGSSRLNIEFWDFDHESPIPASANAATQDAGALPINVALVQQGDHFGAENLKWDPSGRYLVTLAETAEGSSGGGKGYKLWDVAGTLLRHQQVDGLRAFMWRPRPASILSKSARKQIRKEVKALGAEFDIQDATLESEESEELQRVRNEQLAEWSAWRAQIRPKLLTAGVTPEEDRFEVRDGDVYFKKVEVFEEEEEELD